MKTIVSALILCAVALTSAKAQTNVIDSGAPRPTTQAFGKIDLADLEMKTCSFEKDANAMVLFDKADIYPDDQKIRVSRHKRIKIFNDNGKGEANIRIEFIGVFKYQLVENLEAQTINMVNGKPEITKLDRKSVFIENTDKLRSAYVFTFPNVRPGSVLEFKYLWSTVSGIPPWTFQSKIPTRYSVLTTELPSQVIVQIRGGAAAIDNESVKGVSLTSYRGVNTIRRSMTNVPSLIDEPFMTSDVDNLHSVYFRFNDIYNMGSDGLNKLWDKRCQDLIDDEDFGHQINRKLAGEDVIIAKAKTITDPDQKIAYIFNEVRNSMKWNDVDTWYTKDGTVKAWDKKTGNSTEINLVLYHLLTKAGVNSDPLLVSTRDNGKVFGAYPTLVQFNRTVVAVGQPVKYILDAADKYNVYNEIPENLLNNTGLLATFAVKRGDLTPIERKGPTRQITVVAGDVKADGTMAGTVEVTNTAYTRIKNIKKYKTDGEQKYIDYLRNNDNGLKISNLKLENMDVDTLPLVQGMAFAKELTGSDGNYIYFAPAMFSPLRSNPFVTEARSYDVDFGYRDNFSLVGNYKVPAGFKIDVLPKNTTVQMPDQSITFKRVIGEQEGNIVARYIIDVKKTTYTKDEYPQLYDLYKKIYELINEQVVLKKA